MRAQRSSALPKVTQLGSKKLAPYHISGSLDPFPCLTPSAWLQSVPWFSKFYPGVCLHFPLSKRANTQQISVDT